MLNGIAPILMFTFSQKSLPAAFNAIEGIPLVGDLIANNVGVPVPIYLDEGLTGIMVESESKAIDIETKVQARNDGKPPIVDQNGLNSLVTVNMVAVKTSVLLMALLALNDRIFSKVVSKEYSVTYLNGPTLIFNGLLHSFSYSTDENTDKITIAMQISKANQESTQPAEGTGTLEKVTGSTPLAGG